MPLEAQHLTQSSPIAPAHMTRHNPAATWCTRPPNQNHHTVRPHGRPRHRPQARAHTRPPPSPPAALICPSGCSTRRAGWPSRRRPRSQSTCATTCATRRARCPRRSGAT
eukprot:7384539-Prymnesium_polylepis.2